jgi:putative NIF3 family GTP cyclohydrolase 1 type 2
VRDGYVHHFGSVDALRRQRHRIHCVGLVDDLDPFLTRLLAPTGVDYAVVKSMLKDQHRAATRSSALLEQFADLVKERLCLATLRIVGDRGRKISRIALCGGSGASLLREAARQGADLLITGDIKYHEAQEAESLGVTLIDAGHFATERLMIEGLSRQMENELAARKLAVQVVRCCAESDPFEFV